MPHFTPTFLSFFKELSENNNKEWFDANRKTYEKEVKKPFAAFVEEMITRIHAQEPEVQITAKDAVMRINNDTRFSKDKTPYKNHVAANISKFGKKDKAYPGIYFQLSHEGVQIYGGAYMLDTSTLQKIREQIAANPKEFSALLNEKDFKEKFGSIQGEQNKRLPKEFQEAAAEQPLIANKQFYYSAALSPELITSDKLPDVLMEYYAAGTKVNEFLKRGWE